MSDLQSGKEDVIRLRQGSIQPIFAAVNSPQGITAVAQSGGVFSLFGPDGSATPGLTEVGISGFQAGPQPRLRLWQVLDTTSLAPGMYRALFRFSCVFSSDPAEAQTLEREISIDVLPLVTGAATYVASQLERSPLFQTRLFAADTDVERPIWSDDELKFYLHYAGGIPRLAAADALETLATDRARLASAIRIGAFGAGEEEAWRAISERAARLRILSPVMPAVRAPEPIFVPDLPGSKRRGNMRDW